MPSETYRRRVNALAIVCSAAFAGCNLFIGLSMGTYWLSLDPITFMNGFWSQFTHFTFTIMPLFILTLAGLVLSARLDWREAKLKRLWLIAIGLYVAASLITLGYHLPENFRLREALYSPDEAAAARSLWLTVHIPRILIAFGIPFAALWAVFERGASRQSNA
ncbi:MAG: hypothetical protein HC850_10200 [Rhodomicrobium sp.]|nr:hypothetical protein [Rhodomicrobium sp.]